MRPRGSSGPQTASPNGPPPKDTLKEININKTASQKAVFYGF